MSTWLGLDVGTQGLKALLLDDSRGVVARASVPLDTIGGLPAGHSEQRPDDWLDAIRTALDELRHDAADALAALGGIGVSGQQHGLVALDNADRVIRPAMLWNDVRAAAECRAIVAEAGGPTALFDRLGLGGLPPGFTAGKLRWLRDHEPDSLAQLRRVLLPHDYVNLWLTGRAVAEAGDASGTGLFDVRERRFDADFAELVAPGTAAALPELAKPGTVIGTLRDALADELGLPAGVPVATGSGDNMMAAVGCGAVVEGVVCMSLGTSGTVFAHATRPICDPEGEIAPFCDATGGWLPLGCTMNATVATEAARRMFGMSLEDLDAAVTSTPPGADGLTCLPFLTGERSPDLPTSTGSLLGLTPRNATPGHVARAMMEGATFALCRLLDRLDDLGAEATELRLTGGGSHSAAWRSIVASASAKPVVTGVDADAAAVGAAVLAAWSARRDAGESDLTLAACRDAFDLDRELESEPPASDHVTAHRAARRTWDAHLDALTPLFDAGLDSET